MNNATISNNLTNLIDTNIESDVNLDETNSIDESKYNHKARKQLIKNYLKTTIIPIENEKGEIVGKTTAYKKLRKKEKGNFKTWCSRVKRAQTAGKQIHNANIEEIYRKKVEKTNLFLENKKTEFIVEFGEALGLLKYQEFYDNLTNDSSDK